jgi:hypothetical protein
MLSQDKYDLLIERLKLSVKDTIPHEDEEFNAYDWCGGNFDDAYWQGVEAGEVEFAKGLLQFLEE